MKQKKITINAVYEKDLKNFMKKLNLWNDFKNKKLKCGFCGNIVTIENLLGFKLINNEPKAICDQCLTKI